MKKIKTERVLVTAPLGAEAVSQLKELGEVILDPWIDAARVRIYNPEEMAEEILKERADALVCEADACSGPVFDTGIKVIAACRSEPSNVDIPGATSAGIPILHTPGRNADAVAEHTLALLFALNRRVLPADREVRTGQIFSDTIPYQRHRIKELRGRTFGILGLGAVGAAVKWRVEALGMKTLAYDPYNPKAKASLKNLLLNSDIVSVHTPANEKTFQMMDKAEFASCKKGALYLNTARASVHNLEALTSALESGHLGGAGLDHFEGEMLAANHPLLEMDNVVLTPHIGGATYDTEERQGKMVVEDFRRLAKGKMPLHILNPETLA